MKHDNALAQSLKARLEYLRSEGFTLPFKRTQKEIWETIQSTETARSSRQNMCGRETCREWKGNRPVESDTLSLGWCLGNITM